MLDIIRRPLALKDIKNIWIYTRDKWGEKQANQYLQKLDKAITSLAIHPQKGKPAPFIHTGVYLYRAERHAILYYFNQSELTIARILHERMDIKRHKLQ